MVIPNQTAGGNTLYSQLAMMVATPMPNIHSEIRMGFFMLLPPLLPRRVQAGLEEGR